MIKRFHWRIPPLWLQDHLEFGPAKRHAAAIHMPMWVFMNLFLNTKKAPARNKVLFAYPIYSSFA
ncbi:MULTISPECIES: hypothetical protein [Paenibacillus]|uniref:hypothetical protein n=1 Tax=Paenibacillus TaxID=44249 RepID=UPI001FFF6FF2|nr:hypothetical protein [Paenibacillus pabuli]UPK42150.1 hypothetical protein KET34_23430 [Paenibacillus pabuli]